MTSVTLALLLAENSLFKKVGEIFQPVFKLFGYVLAFIYGIIRTTPSPSSSSPS